MATVPLTPSSSPPKGPTPTTGSQRPARATPAGEWLFGHYHLVSATARLHVGERSYELDPRALSVLDCLLRHAGEVVPRAVLIAEAWPDVDTVLDSTVSKVMRRLRLALGDGGGHVLQTVYGEGYRLALPATWLPSTAPGMIGRPGTPAARPAQRAQPTPQAQAHVPPPRRGPWLAWLPWAVAVLALLLAGYLGWQLMRAAGVPA